VANGRLRGPIKVFDGSSTVFDFIKQTSPQDVLFYYLHTSTIGRTTIHTPTCHRRPGCQCPPGRHNKNCHRRPGCTCPVDKAHGSLNSLNGQIRGVFKQIGRVDPFNPCGDPEITEFLKYIAREQQLGGVCASPAVPVFQDKLMHVLGAIDLRLSTSLTNVERLVHMRDAAAFAVDSASGQRGRDRLSLRIAGIITFPGNNSLVLGFEWGKTVRSGTLHHFGFRVRTDFPILCPVTRLLDYIAFGLSIGIPFRDPGAFVFPPVRGNTIQIGHILKSINPGLIFWLDHLDINEGETAYGLRPAFAIEEAIRGQPLAKTMAICQWRGQAMHDRYTRLWEILTMDPDTPLTIQHYRDLNVLRGASNHFPRICHRIRTMRPPRRGRPQRSRQ
jgi:hypothetical protein